MSALAGALVSELLQRVRDPQGAIHPRATARAILSQAQRAINTGFRSVLATGTLTTEPRRVI